MAEKSYAGLEGKWQSLADEREELKAKNAELEAKVLELEAWKKGYENADLSTALAERDQIKADLADAKTNQGKILLALSEEERDALEHVLASYDIITKVWRLQKRQGPLDAALGVFASYIQQRLLSGLDGSTWASWWETERTR